MVSEDCRCQLVETARIRDQADDLLHRLLNERRRCEERLAETGRRDPIKAVTGRSSIDNAIAATRDMIRNMDALIEQISGELDGLQNLPASDLDANGSVERRDEQAIHAGAAG